MSGFSTNTQILSALGAGAPAAVVAKPLNASMPSILCVLSNGAVLTYQIEVTGDDLTAPNYNPANGNWAPFTDLIGLSASMVATLGAVVTGIRPRITSYTSGALTFQFVQTRDA